ncbi:MAG: aminopeptidase [Pseudohongiellaceae bacterium]
MLAEEWGSSGGYDSWFSGSLNNAQLSTVTSYNDLVPYFENLLAQSNGDLETFYSQVFKLSYIGWGSKNRKITTKFLGGT